MSALFQGWRRRAGCALLVVACALMVAWLRSYLSADDVLRLTSNGQLYSHNGSVSWNMTSVDDAFANVSGPQFMRPRVIWRNEFFGFVGTEIVIYGRRTIQYWVPYWSFVTPLTLLSGYLILWKSRQASPANVRREY